MICVKGACGVGKTTLMLQREVHRYPYNNWIQELKNI
jgi:hypothetical protein